MGFCMCVFVCARVRAQLDKFSLEKFVNGLDGGTVDEGFASQLGNGDARTLFISK